MNFQLVARITGILALIFIAKASPARELPLVLVGVHAACRERDLPVVLIHVHDVAYDPLAARDPGAGVG